MRAQIAKTPLKHERLAQPFDITTSERQLAKFERGRFPRLAMAGARRCPIGAHGRLGTFTTQGQSQWDDERAENDRVRQRVGRRLERPAVRVELRERLPELRAGLVME